VDAPGHAVRAQARGQVQRFGRGAHRFVRLALDQPHVGEAREVEGTAAGVERVPDPEGLGDAVLGLRDVAGSLRPGDAGGEDLVAGPCDAGELGGAEEAVRVAGGAGGLIQAPGHLAVLSEGGAGPGVGGVQQGAHVAGQVPQRPARVRQHVVGEAGVAVFEVAAGELGCHAEQAPHQRAGVGLVQEPGHLGELPGAGAAPVTERFHGPAWARGRAP
jgi:hypothetical protein